MDYFRRQIQHIIRRLMRAPVFTVVTLVTLAVSIGSNAAVFSVINGVLLKPLPYPDSERLVNVNQSAVKLDLPDLSVSPSDYFTFREENRTFQDFGLWSGGSVSVTGLAEPEQVRSLNVTDGTLQALGVQPFIGRWFNAQDDTPGTPETVMLTYAYWQQRFGGSPTAIGKQLTVSGMPREIIGVMPQDFRFLNQKPDLMLPLRFDRSKVVLGNFSYHGIARLKPTVTIEQANADVARMIPLVNERYQAPPGFNIKMFVEAGIAANLRPLKDSVVGDVGKVLWVLMGTIGVVLLIACANVANLLLVRAEGRQQELAVRAALGAGWKEVAGELLFESLFLAVVGGVLGLALAYGALRLLVSMGPANLPRLDNISIDPAVVLFGLTVAMVSGLLFGLIPVLKYAGPHPAMGLRASTRSQTQSRERHRARNTLVVVQVALALVLLVSSGLMIRTFRALKEVRPGFSNGSEVQTLRISIPDAEVHDPEAVVRMQNDILDKLAGLPGVASATMSNSVPMDGNNWNDPIYAEDRTYTEAQVPAIRRFKFVGPDFFRTLGNPVIAGRDFTWTDIYEKRDVVIISENMARELWQEPSSAIGKRIRESGQGQFREIVGVVGDVRDSGADQPAPAIAYWPVLMKNFEGDAVFVSRGAVFVLRSSRAGSDSLIQEARQAVWTVNPNLPVAAVRTLDEIYSGSIARTSFTMSMLAIAAGMALLLGIVGIYGVMSYSVSQRRREIGIRIALGARHQELTGMFVRFGLLLAGIGTACGLVASFALTRLMSSLLFQVSPTDPLTYAAVSVALIGAAVAASYLPARRTTSVNPVEALRSE
jgi:putative ABC transport system permease protein